MTSGQIDKAVNNFRVLLEKHSKNLDQDLVQKALGNKRLADDMLSTFYRHIDIERPMLVLKAKIDLSLTPYQFLATINAQKNLDLKAVQFIPRVKSDEIEVCFFQLSRYVDDNQLEGEYKLRGLNPADPVSQIAVNIANPSFMQNHSNATHWNPFGLTYYFSTIMAGFEKPTINIGPCGGVGFGTKWWFAGVRK